MLSGGASSLVAVASVGIINSRHLLYGAVLSEYLEKLSFIKKLLISYVVVDQGFAESNKFFKKNRSEEFLHYHLIGTGCTMWVCWQIATLSGIVLGSFVPEELGLKFAIPLTFIAIVVQDLKKLDHVIVMITCGLSSLLFFDAPFKSYIIISPINCFICSCTTVEVKKMTLTAIIFAGILTYFTRMTMIALISRDMLGDKIKAVLEYVPSAVFPAIIFPGIFINDFGTFIEMNDPKIFGALVAVIVGYFSKNIIATISAGLVSYWFLIFVVFN